MNEDDKAARRQETARATGAKAILENPLWVESWTEIERNLQARMEDAGTDAEGTYDAKRQLVAIRTVKKQLERLIETGKLAEHQLAENAEKESKHG